MEDRGKKPIKKVYLTDVLSVRGYVMPKYVEGYSNVVPLLICSAQRWRRQDQAMLTSLSEESGKVFPFMSILDV